MAEYRKKFVSLDLETTHLDEREGKIMEVGVVECEIFFDEQTKNVDIEFGEQLDTLVNPEIEPSSTALNLTGIKQSELQEAPLWKEIKPKLADFLEDKLLLGHNLGFDLGFLKFQGLNLKNQFLDTLEAAQTFLPLSPSFSLEFLSESLGIKITTSHRALADSKSAAMLLVRIVNEFLGFDSQIQKQIKAYLTSSNLVFRDLFLDLPEVKVSKKRRTDSQKMGIQELDLSDSSEYQIFRREWPDKKILNLPVGFNKQQELLGFLAKPKDFPALVAVSKSMYLDVLTDEQKIPEPEYTLCEKKWDWFRGRADLPDSARKVAIKILLLQNLRNSHDLSYLKWGPDEFGYLKVLVVESVTCLDHKCDFVKRLHSKKNQTLFLTLPTLFLLTFEWKINFSRFRLLLFDLAEIENWFRHSLTQVLNLKKIHSEISKLYAVTDQTVSILDSLPAEVEEVLNESDLFFGLLHFVYLKREGEFAQNLLIDDRESTADRFSKLFHPARKFIVKLEKFSSYLENQMLAYPDEVSTNFLSLRNQINNFSNFLKDFFTSRSDGRIYWLKFNSQWVDLNLSPSQISSAWQEFSKRFLSTTIVETELPRVSMKYFETQLGLHGYEMEKISLGSGSLEKLQLNLHQRELATSQIVDLLIELVGSVIFVLPNENQLARYFEILSENSDFPKRIIAYKLSGSNTKLKTLFSRATHETDPYVFLVTNNGILKYFYSFPKAQNLLITRLPFEAPNANMRYASRNDFVEQVLPRALHLLHLMLSRFAQAPGDQKQVHLLDARAYREYDGTFLHYLEEVSNFHLLDD